MSAVKDVNILINKCYFAHKTTFFHQLSKLNKVNVNHDNKQSLQLKMLKSCTKVLFGV